MIENLTGAIRAFFIAADVDGQNGVQGNYETALLSRLLGGANLYGEEGLVVEMNNNGMSNKQIQKEENKMYKEIFGKDEVDSVKRCEEECNRRVVAAFTSLKTDSAHSPEEVNKAIASRPKMPAYRGRAEDYKMELQNWAKRVETALDTSNKQHTSNTVAAAVKQINKNTNEKAALIIANDILNAEMLSQEIEEGNAKIIEKIETAEGNIKKTIKLSTGQIINVVYDAAGKILEAVYDNQDLTIAYGEANLEETRFQHNLTRWNSYNQAESVKHHTEVTVDNAKNEILREMDNKDKIEAKYEHMQALINNLDQLHTTSTIDRMSKLADRVRTSKLSVDEKDELMDQLITRSKDVIISDSEMDELETIINEALDE